MHSYKSIIIHVVFFLLFSLASIFITFPLIFHLGEYITGFGDETLLAWIQNWVIHALLSGNILALFDANIYFPYQNTLAYSDTHFISAVLGIIPVLLTKQPIASTNFSLISSLACLGFSIYLLCFYLTKNIFTSFLSGIFVIFSPAVISNYVHIQMLVIYFVPLAILFFLHFLASKQTKYLVISLCFFVAQTYNSFLPGYFILFSYLIIFLTERKKFLKLITKKRIVIFFFALLLIVPIAIPYYQVSKEFHYSRDIRDAIHLSLQPEDFFYTSGFSRLQPYLNNLPFNRVSQNNEFKPGFLGVMFTLTVLFAFYYVLKHFKKKEKIISSFFAIALTGFALSLGPVLHLGRHTLHDPVIPLPYALFYYIVPGFQGFRNSARWELLFILAAAVVISFVLSKILKKYSRKMQIMVVSVLIIGSIAEYNFPMHFEKVVQTQDFPKVYSWLATTPKETVIIEYPIYVWYMHPYVFDENMREYYATVHFRKMVNGASGFSPFPWQKMAVSLMKEFPSKKTLIYLKTLGVNTLIFHEAEYDKLAQDKFAVNGKVIQDGETILDSLKKNNQVRLIKRFDNDYVFSIL